MDASKISCEQLYKIVEFIAKKKGMSVENYVDSIQEEMESAAAVESLMENFRKLTTEQQAEVISTLVEKGGEMKNYAVTSGNSQKTNGEYTLEELSKKDVGELVKTKPHSMKIGGRFFETKSWTDVSSQFVRFLVDKGEISGADLPLCPSNRSEKAFINSYAGQPAGVKADSNFVKVADNFYIDSKYNAKYHVLNILRTLKKLQIESKYPITILI